ncbi:MRX complex nuclease subunit Ecym_6250 [Eremothecium cymbalariae DBVPG|uniref:Double-strand break repair protein n=1 Tax=Eremothecium cymbalariae (strain CBS 270.75 / DBVPG 7215 / KCTC 17166 / NRRL Y-17582) TaxID=931890 RepID=G8JVF3_ERECY|nr:hypothetical protein Ecym_6250 [Eremothecium cymbalariae DBVPG\
MGSLVGELDEYPDSDTIRILITTDNHVGYNESDPIMGDDSWKTFHEIMMLAKSKNVDMILQGGDLFHVNKPSKKSMYQVMRSIRLACMGDKACELELLSDPCKVFKSNEFRDVNYEDPNFNISIPMFAIAGNHDDASGNGLLTPMDILQVSGLINHFGKVEETDNIDINPLLFRKGVTQLALYGLASIRDERLFRTFKEGHVKFNVPSGDTDKWFNIMCVHQNHSSHANTAFLPEAVLPEFLDLVIWGHEHECIPHLVHNSAKGFDVLQPGSSVATALCSGESRDKFVFILELKQGQSPKLVPIPLATVRPFLMDDITLAAIPGLKPHDKEGIVKQLVNKVNSLIEKANDLSSKRLGIISGEENEKLAHPLIRLRVNYISPQNSSMDYQVENPRRFSNRFVGRVANANNVVQFYKRKLPGKHESVSSKKNVSLNLDALNQYSHADGELQVETLFKDLLSGMSLSLLPEIGMNEAVRKFVDKDDKTALKQFIDHEVNHEVKLLSTNKDFLRSENLEDLKKLVKQVKLSTQSTADPPASITGNSANSEVEMNSFMDETTESQLGFESTKPAIKRATKNIKSKRAKSTQHGNRLPELLDLDEEEIDDDIVSVSIDEDSDDNLMLSEQQEENSITRVSTEHSAGHKSTFKGANTKSKRTASKDIPTRRSTSNTPKTAVLQALLNKKRGPMK